MITEEGVSPSVQLVFDSMLGETSQTVSSGEEEEDEDDDDEDDDEEEDSLSYVDDKDDEDYKMEEEEEEMVKKGPTEKKSKKKAGTGKQTEKEVEDPTVGDIFALEMELNRKSKKIMKERRHRSKLPRALRGLMGEANIRYARGDKDDAIVMCMEIIRQGMLPRGSNEARHDIEGLTKKEKLFLQLHWPTSLSPRWP